MTNPEVALMMLSLFIVLVMLVRTLLHPLTKKSQVSMQRFGKVMGEMKPELEKLKKKYPDDPKKFQQEHGLTNVKPGHFSVMRYMREIKRLQHKHDQFVKSLYLPGL